MIRLIDGGGKIPKVDKSVGLHKVAELLDIPMEAVAAIGDSDNDIRMLEDAGFGIAMGNALDRVKCKADAVTLSNEEDGVACFYCIERCYGETVKLCYNITGNKQVCEMSLQQKKAGRCRKYEKKNCRISYVCGQPFERQKEKK